MSSTPVKIRWIVSKDLPEVLEIENTAEGKWEEENFILNLKQRNIIGLVAEYKNKILGFVFYKFTNELIEILHLATLEGSVVVQLVDKLKSKLATQHKRWLIVDIDQYDTASHLLFSKLDFTAVQIEPDTYRFTYTIGNPKVPTNRISRYV